MICIRPYTVEDYDAVQRLLELGGMFDAIRDSKSQLAILISRDFEAVLVAEDDVSVVGCVYVISLWQSMLFRLAVHPNHRRKGIGTKLVHAGEAVAKKHGCREILLFAKQEDENLGRFYDELHYERGSIYQCRWKKL